MTFVSVKGARIPSVCTNDALMFTEPNELVWKILIAVVDGLEFLLEGDEFDAAIDELEEHLASWSQMLRVCPEHWLADFLAECPSPKIRLVKHYSIRVDRDCPKGTARQLVALAQTGNLDGIESVSFVYARKQKYFMKAVTAFFNTAKPDQFTLVEPKMDEENAVLDAIEASGVTTKRVSALKTTPIPWSSHLDSMSRCCVFLDIETPTQFQELLAQRDLQHIMSLVVRLHFSFEYYDSYDWSRMSSAPADWRSLRHLHIQHDHNLPREIWGIVAHWLSRARPTYIGGMYFTDTASACAAFTRAGIYSRAYGSTLKLSDAISEDQAFELLSTGSVRVRAIEYEYPLTGVSMSTLVSCMHESTRRALHRLRWPVIEDDIVQIDRMLESLPRLRIWEPWMIGFATVEQRKPTIRALVASRRVGQLGVVRLVDPSRPKPLAASERKLLERDSLLDPGSFFVSSGP